MYRLRHVLGLALAVQVASVTINASSPTCQFAKTWPKRKKNYALNFQDVDQTTGCDELPNPVKSCIEVMSKI
jgi:hypothetical protein